MKKLLKSGLFALMTLAAVALPTGSAWAHGGASVDIDTCRLEVTPGNWMHFTAYTPLLTADTEYCGSIPGLGKTNLVFDYEGKELRYMTVEFEITKEPEGTRVYYQEPKQHKTGSVNAVVDFTKHGAGQYLAHISLINEGKKTDAHMAFTVGGVTTPTDMMIIAAVLIGGLLAFYFLNPGFKKTVNGLLGKKSSEPEGE